MQLSLVLLLAFIPSLVLASTSLNCNDTYQCICGDSDDEEPFGKFVHCDIDKRIVRVDILMCITYENRFVVGNCPFSSRMLSTEHQKGRYALPNELVSVNTPTDFNTDVMCRPMNRTGRNCGKCNNATAVAINSYFLPCVPREKCHWYNWLLVLLADLGPVTILFIIIVVFHIRFTSGYANTYIFFAQMVSMQINVIDLERDWIYVLANTNGTSADDIVIPLISVYSIWSLDLGRCIAPNLCMSHHVNNIHTFGLQYLIAVYGFVLIITAYVLVELHARNVRLIVWLWRPFGMCFSRFQRQLNAQTSLIDAFATFILLSYSKFVFTSIMLLSYANLFDRSGKIVGRVLLYDGTVDYFGTEHLPLAVVAVLVLIIFVLLPLAMILYPFKCVQRCLTRCKLNRPALVAFMDAIQGCYKDGTNGTRDLRYFSAVYWLARVVVFALYTTYTRPDVYPEVQLCLLFMCSCLIVLVATLRPYKRNIYNHFDVTMLAYFALVVGGCMYHHWTRMLIFKRELSLAFEILSVLFLMMPFLVAVGYVSVQLCTFVRSSACVRWWVPSINRARPGYLTSNLGHLPPDSPQSNPFPDRLLRPEVYTEDNMQSRRARRFYGAV